MAYGWLVCVLVGTLVVLPTWLWQHVGPPAALIPWLLACSWVIELCNVAPRYWRRLRTGS